MFTVHVTKWSSDPDGYFECETLFEAENIFSDECKTQVIVLSNLPFAAKSTIAIKENGRLRKRVTINVISNE